MPCECGCSIVTIESDESKLRCICDGCGKDRTGEFMPDVKKNDNKRG